MDDLEITRARGNATTAVWQARCKDCQAEKRGNGTSRPAARRHAAEKVAQGAGESSSSFEYSANWADYTLERGNSRSDRCERHRQAHRAAIRALPVAYIDLQAIGEVADRKNPTGPLGGLGSLPIAHREKNHASDLERFELGMSDTDILKLLKGLSEKRVAVVEAGTGTGKSTFMPFRLMNPPTGAVLRLNDFGPIIVTEPRKAAATGVAAFVGEAMCFGHDNRTCRAHVGPGFPVGYQVSGDRNWDSACQLIYVTDGTMINWVREGRLATIGTVIVDEAHERSENIDIILAQLRDQVRRFEHLRVIITSATMDKDFFIEYFGGPQNVYYQHVEARKSFGYGVPFFIGTEVSDEVIERGLVAGPNGPYFDSWAELGQKTGDEAPENLRETTRLLREVRRQEVIPEQDWKELMPRRVATQIVDIASVTEHGDILGFLPTTDAINEAVVAIKSSLGERSRDFDVYPLLSTTPPAIRDKALEGRSRGEKRKIVVSSNLAETSLTVKGVRFVVDSGLICQPEWDPSIASGSFPTKTHSQSGVRQRWGRVGRDAPGWVFPLYSLEQFQSFAKNTPPGSTQANLETFCMKLISAGLEMDHVSLPANFLHQNVNYDEDARRNIKNFDLEIARARGALAASGAVDRDGHLTDFGRELERFPGSGSRAIAIMLADQLACIHEVAVALAVLCDNRLVGGEQGLFLFDREWPAAWRVHATRCHRALTLGCTDDLDVVLRIFSEWQAAEDRGDWCSIWWINAEAISIALSAVDEVISALSPAMKGNAERPILPALANRARAVLTRAMGSHRFNRVEGIRYKKPDDDETQCVNLDHSVLVPDPGDRIIALNRFRLPDEQTGEARDPIITNTIRILDWAEGGGGGSDEMGLDLILLAAANLPRDSIITTATDSDSMRAVRAEFPIGIIVDMVVTKDADGPATVEKSERRFRPFRYPGSPSDRPKAAGDSGLGKTASRRRSLQPSGFDPDWDPISKDAATVPDEETAQELLDIRVFENNEDPLRGQSAAKSREIQAADRKGGARPLPRLQALSPRSSTILAPQMRVEIIGYQAIDTNTVALIVSPIGTETNPTDPAEHNDLNYGDTVDVLMLGVVNDHQHDLAEFERADGRGNFYLSGLRSGIDAYDRDFVHRLRPGTRHRARAIPGWSETERISISFLPAAVEHLLTATSEDRLVAGNVVKIYPATIVEPENPWGKVVVELDHRDEAKGISHRFSLWKGYLTRSNGLSLDVGQRLLVGLGNDPEGRRRRVLQSDDKKVLEMVARYPGSLRLADKQISASGTLLHLDIIREFAAMIDNASWQRDVWLFHLDSHHLEPVSVQPILARIAIDFPLELVAQMRVKKVEIGQTHKVSITINEKTNNAEIIGPDAAAIEAAANDMRLVASLPFIVAIVPAATVGRLLGTKWETINRLRVRTNVLDIHLDEETFTVTVIGRSANAVTETLREMRLLVNVACGEMMVPANCNGRIIGKAGVQIKTMQQTTGCRAENRDKGPRWLIEGPTESAVNQFIELAKGSAPGTTGRVTETKMLRVIKDATKPPPKPKSVPPIASDARPDAKPSSRRSNPSAKPDESLDARKSSDNSTAEKQEIGCMFPMFIGVVILAALVWIISLLSK